MLSLNDYISEWNDVFPSLQALPWSVTSEASSIVNTLINSLDGDYFINGGIAIHKNAVIEEGVILKGPVVISSGCFVGAHAYLRGGVFLGEGVSVGPGCEIKSSYILSNSALAHFNFVGDSILGSHINMEAGAVIANHYNERSDKTINVLIDDIQVSTGVPKFGALVGDYAKIGANAVLSPGTILRVNSIIGRLTLVEQC